MGSYGVSKFESVSDERVDGRSDPGVGRRERRDAQDMWQMVVGSRGSSYGGLM